jgi:hypothetical protein
MGFEAKGALAILYDLMVDYRGSIPDDGRYVAGVLGVSLRKWTSIRRVLLAGGRVTAADGRLWAPASQKSAPAGGPAAALGGDPAELRGKGEDKSRQIRAKSKDNSGENDTASNENNALPMLHFASRAKGQGQGQKIPPLTPPDPQGGGGDLPLPEFLNRGTPDTEFSDFWKAWRPEPDASQPKALAAWRATAQRRPALPLLLACVDAYNAHHDAEQARRRTSRPPLATVRRYSPENWLTDERWTGFLDKAKEARDVPVSNNFNGHGARLADVLGAATYRSYFADAHYDADANVILVPTDFRRETIDGRFRAALVDVFGETVRVETRQ